MKRALFVFVMFSLFASVANAADGRDEVVRFEYDGQLIEISLDDLILTQNGVQLYDPSAYYFEEEETIIGGQQRREISQEEYLEEQKAQSWFNIQENLEIRSIDERALELVREFQAATGAVPPTLGQSGAVVVAYSTYIPKVICRPLYVTDIILEPGEIVTGIHPGDTARWVFVPGEVGEGNNRQISVLVKPLVADISTNLIIMTNRRRYHLDLLSSTTNFIPSISFTYPQDGMAQWNDFIRARAEQRNTETVIEAGYQINPEDLHLRYSIEGSDSLRWKPIAAYDDGIKTYIRMSIPFCERNKTE